MMQKELGYGFCVRRVSNGEMELPGVSGLMNPDKVPFQEQCVAKLGAQLGNTKPSQAGFLGFRPCNGMYHNAFCTTQVPLW